MTTDRHIVALGGGGFGLNAPIHAFALDLCDAARPNVCFVPTASGDADAELDAFYAAFSDRAETSHIGLFRRKRDDIAGRLRDADLIYVGGGNPANLLAIWRLHGVDQFVADAYHAGAVVVGLSAGASCLFEGSLTDSFGRPLIPMADGLGLIQGTFCPHYDHAKRRPQYREAVAAGFDAGFGLEAGAALHFVNGELAEVLSARAGARAYRVGPTGESKVPDRALEST